MLQVDSIDSFIKLEYSCGGNDLPLYFSTRLEYFGTLIDSKAPVTGTQSSMTVIEPIHQSILCHLSVIRFHLLTGSCLILTE